ncbi:MULTISPECIES: ParA family protein [Bacillus cereus group]|uniref:ParA family protein n=1 Tax=Bacillus cereus group TaxID=86661 RepID=UPI000BFE58EF|nr:MULTISPECIES: AAA family ATPase [Bacillus cereus group]MDA1902908.1 AAA family ATPase [Bacillus cereus group sp. BcHK20]MDF0737754.1 AAA family ATPase [Bacillus pacificus]MDG1651262.1 AAA family ATPase [Bacillus pacificus]PGR57468.1 cobyrinic acid a,c-diamide synthase [Bacillus cereus]UEP94720.1 AAA family ATPase [Bacillus pacificus]
MTRVISIINYKGGVGKTTLTANLGAELAFQGHKVLLIDLDPQTNLTFSFVQVDEWENNYENRTIKKWFDAFIDEDSDFNLRDLLISPERVNRRLNEFRTSGSIDIISSHLGLINVDLELSAKLWGGSERQNRRNFVRVHSRLKDGLKQLEELEYDFVLIDCPPNFNIVTKTAIVASDVVLLPAKADYLSTIGITQVDKNVNELVEEYNDKIKLGEFNEYELINPELMGVVFTMVGIRSGGPISAQQQYIAQVERLEGIRVFETKLRENKTLYANAPEAGIPVVLKDVQGGDTYLNVRTELEELVVELQDKILN